MIQIPVTDNGNSEFDVSIEGIVYTLRYNYNVRNNRLYLSILKDGSMIVSGLRLIEGGKPISTHRYLDLPNGELYIALFGFNGGTATIDTLGINKSFSLVFLTQDEVDQLS